ncbi:MAG: hypothetical protein RBT80_01815 [Candidatus Vecturithrix sp.]|jgi:uncharacterized protein involved in propanediol utilization|nr:hypothetical protein [Candidatus Vecturithrix sp.]
MQAISIYFGSCGELLQDGNKGVPMLISCPINHADPIPFCLKSCYIAAIVED